MSGPLLTVDTPYLLFRAAFSLPDSITDGEGHPVNALLGSANAILQVVEDRAPRAVVVCFGAEAATYRTALYSAYHAHREPMPEPLDRQFADAPGFFAAFGWTVAGSDDLEADDLMHSYALTEAEAGGTALILTGDRDMFQSVGDGITVLYAAQSKGGPAEVDAAEVRRRYGVGPDLVPDFIALRGDPSDGLPGGRGIGEKTAADLLRRHGSLEGAIAAALGETPRIRGTLRDQAEELRAFRDIATLRRVDVELPPDAGLDRRAAAAAARGRGMSRLAARIEAGGA
jgi:DNA polymerase-1